MPSNRQVTIFRNRLARLREKRRQAKTSNNASRRALTSKQRDLVLQKTDGRCHICGGKVGHKWQADHVSSHAHGGAHAEDNYLAAHALCNNYRWHYLPEELQVVMKLGIWARMQVEKGTPLGMEIAERFVAHERRRESRRVTR
ncbi:MAG: HNH endonuclease [Myxococcales bacterium]|nr:HNH endonuclease [Myxococcales bacterium]